MGHETFTLLWLPSDNICFPNMGAGIRLIILKRECERRRPTLGDSSVELETFFWSWSFRSFFSFRSRRRSFFSRRSRSFSSRRSLLLLVPFLPATALKALVSLLWMTRPRVRDFLAATRRKSAKSVSWNWTSLMSDNFLYKSPLFYLSLLSLKHSLSSP